MGIIGYADQFLLQSNTKVRKFSNNNEAELEAVKWAATKVDPAVEIHTDSQYAIDNYRGSHIVRKCNRENTANIVVRSHKEDLRK